MLGSYVWRILVVIIVCLVLANPLFVSQYYTSVEDLDDTIGDEALIKNCSSPSLTTCASRCHDACTCFAYNSKDNRCDLLEKCSGALPTRTENGWHYFRKTEGRKCKIRYTLSVSLSLYLSLYLCISLCMSLSICLCLSVCHFSWLRFSEI